MSVSDKGDRDAVAAATIAAGLLIAQQVAGRTTRDAFFLSDLPASEINDLHILDVPQTALTLLGSPSAESIEGRSALASQRT